VVTASQQCLNPPVVVIYHGVQETISEWVKAQRFLYDRCVSSVVFDYTGSGNSSRPARFEALGEDSIAAYEFAAKHYPGRQLYVLGHSMGNGRCWRRRLISHLRPRESGRMLSPERKPEKGRFTSKREWSMKPECRSNRADLVELMIKN
jgi:hypothetical protein